MLFECSNGLTLKAFVVGTLMSLGVGVGSVCGSLVLRSSRMAMNFNAPAATFGFFVLVGLLNVLLGLIRKDAALDRSELLVVYIMMVVAASIPTMGFTQYLPVITGAFYCATPENNWANLVHPYIPEWPLVQSRDAVWDFYEGLAKGRSIPWEAWAQPLFYWCSFFVVLCFTMICIMVVVRKQWVEHERLIYPLAQLPLEMVKDDARGSRVKSFFKNPVMWAGFAVPFIVGSTKALHNYYYIIPAINLSTSIPLFRRTLSLSLRPSFPLIGFSYLVNLDIAFGFWFFHLFGIVERGLFNMFGLESSEKLTAYVTAGPDLAHQGMGAMITLVGFSLWVGRKHLRAVFRKALKGDPQVDDSDEILPYRVAVFGMMGGMLFTGIWMWRSGLPPLLIPMFLFGLFVLYLAITRALTEGALAAMMPPLTPLDFVVSGVGTSAVSPAGMGAFALTWVWGTELRTFVMASSANGLKIAQEIGGRGRKRLLFWAMLLAIMVSLAGSIWALLYFSYRYGGVNLHEGFAQGQSRFAFDDMARKMVNPSPPDLRGWFFTGLGGLIMGFLMWLRHRVLWWPMHPLGFAIGCAGGWIGGVMWLSAFIAWVLKAVILKYGGAKLYRQARPFFLGLILGQAAVAGVWLVIDSFTGMTGNVVAVF